MAGKTSLGRLTLDLLANIGAFELGMDKAERKAKAATDKIKKQFETMRKGVNSSVSKLFAGLGAGFSLKAIIDNTIQLEQEQAQLKAALESTGRGHEISLDTLNSKAAELSKQSLFSTNEINRAQTALTVFTGIATSDLDRVMQATADMATRMNMDMTAAAETIGRSLDIPSKGMAALSRQGFRFTDQQKELVKYLEDTGRTADAQKVILGALEETYKGAASAARNTFGGALKAVQNTLSGLMTGEAGSLDAAKQGVEDLNKALSDPKVQESFAAMVNYALKGLTLLAENIDWVVKSMEGVKTVFNVTGNLLVAGYAGVTGAAKKLEEATEGVLGRVLKATPVFGAASQAIGLISKGSDDAATSLNVMEQALQGANDALMSHGQPLAPKTAPQLPAPVATNGNPPDLEALAKEKAEKEALAKLEEERRKAAEAAAKAAMEADKRQQEAINSELTALQRAAIVWGMNEKEVKLYDLALQGANASQIEQAKTQLELVENLQKQQDTRENYLSLVKSLQTEEERRKETLKEQFALLKDMEALSGESDKETFKRAAMGAFEDNAPADKYQKEDEWERLKKDKEAQDGWYAQQLELLNDYRQQRQDLSEEWDQKEAALKEQHQKGLAAIEAAQQNKSLKELGSALGAVAALRDSESKKMRAAGKVAAIAQTTIDAYQAATAALASASKIPFVGWIMGPIAAASILAMGMANVAKIKGQAHSGIDSVPESGTWLLEKGERVTTAKTSAKLDATLERVSHDMQASSAARSGRNVAVNQTIQVTGTIDRHTASQLAADAAKAQRLASARFG